MYILACDVPVVNNTCSTGFKSVSQSVFEPDLMTLSEYEILAPYVLGFIVLCAVYNRLSKF